jgi:Tfp pilus assembly protein PilW
MRRLLHEESGFTLIELVIVMTFTVLLVAAVSNLFVSGLRASSTANATLSSQTQIHLALDRLEFEARCTSQATLVSSGAGVTLTLPSQCPHASGTATYCVTGGSLIRYPAAGCSGSGETLASDITSATPFCISAATGDYPQLHVALTAQTQSSSDEVSAMDTITMRNAALATSTSACT